MHRRIQLHRLQHHYPQPSPYFVSDVLEAMLPDANYVSFSMSRFRTARCNAESSTWILKKIDNSSQGLPSNRFDHLKNPLDPACLVWSEINRTASGEVHCRVSWPSLTHAKSCPNSAGLATERIDGAGFPLGPVSWRHRCRSFP